MRGSVARGRERVRRAPSGTCRGRDVPPDARPTLAGRSRKRSAATRREAAPGRGDPRCADGFRARRVGGDRGPHRVRAPRARRDRDRRQRPRRPPRRRRRRARPARSRRGARSSTRSPTGSPMRCCWAVSPGTSPPATRIYPVLVLAVAGLSMVISYERAKAESLGLQAKGGLMERAERFVFLGVGCAFDLLVPVMWVMLALTAFTAVQRFVIVWRQADRPVRPPRAAPRTPARRPPVLVAARRRRITATALVVGDPPPARPVAPASPLVPPPHPALTTGGGERTRAPGHGTARDRAVRAVRASRAYDHRRARDLPRVPSGWMDRAGAAEQGRGTARDRRRPRAAAHDARPAQDGGAPPQPGQRRRAPRCDAR